MRSLPRLVLMLSLALGVTANAQDFLPQAKHRIICFGDSITAMNKYGPMMQDMINTAFPERNIVVLNRGVSGDTAAGALKRVKIDITDAKPDWVLINFGMNDQDRRSVEEFIADNEALIDRIERDTKAKVVVVSPICNDHSRTGKVMKLDSYAVALRELAKRRKLIYVPLTEESNRIRLALPKDVPLSPDGTHPSRIGYWVYTQTILKTLGFPMPKEPIKEDVPVNLLSGDTELLKTGTVVSLDLPTPVTMTLVPPPVFKAIARGATKPVVIDGKLDEWNREDPINLVPAKDVIGEVMRLGRVPIAATAWASWDGDALNLAFEVTDPLVTNSDKPCFVVARDCIEVCLDLRPAAEQKKSPAIAFGGTTPRTGQYIISPAVGDMKAARCDMGNGPVGMLEGVQVASTLIKGGYRMEMHIPKSLLPDGGPKAGQVLGFDWAAIDVPASSEYHHALTRRWTGSLGSWRLTRDFGTLTLLPKP